MDKYTLKKQLVIIGIVAVLVCVGLSGCNEQSNNPPVSDRNKFVGTWTAGSPIVSYSFTFFSDGTGSMSGLSMTWEIKDGKLVMTSAEQSITLAYSYAFSNNDRTLTLTSPSETVTLTKQ
jgi:hypothetical protein